MGDVSEDDGRREELAKKGLGFTWWAETRPGAPALLSAHGTRTYDELDRRANRLVRALRGRGVRPGDAVALVCGNRPEFAEVLAACNRSGLRLTPINWHLSSDEAAYITDDCDARAVISETSLGPSAAGAASVRKVEVRLAIDGGGVDAVGYEQAPYESALSDESDGPLDDPTPGTVMLYTSGTTGRPKGVRRSAPATGSRALAALFGYRQDGTDVHLSTGPLYHAAPLAFSLAIPLASGAAVVLMESWRPEEALELVARHHVTHTHMVPTMFHHLLSLPEETRSGYDTSSLRWVLHGAAPCPVETKRKMIEWLGPVIWEYYAATEGVGSFVDSGTWLAHPGTVGRPIREGQLKIGNEAGEELARDEVGLVWLRGSGDLRFEYFKDAQKTTGAYRGDYFTLGDMGYMDQEGYVYLTDRAADVIISGGVNIYPAETEAVLLAHPAVLDAAVIGVPNPVWGEEVKAVVELCPGVTASAELAGTLIEFTRERLAHYKCPASVEFVDGLPRGENGKLYRRLLRDRYGQSPPGPFAGAERR